jgi:enediyne biosynthesis protein E4
MQRESTFDLSSPGRGWFARRRCLVGALTGLVGILALAVQAAPGQAWEQRDGHRLARLNVPATGRTGFTRLPPEQTGVWFSNQLSYDRALTNQNMLNGSGVAAGDFNHDGRCDLFFANLDGRCALYQNLGGWKFEDVTLAAGVACTNQASRGAVFADINGDGFLDLVVGSVLGPNACFLNDGHGHFTDVTEQAGLALWRAGCESLALADVDGDGDLDLYIANNGDNSILRSGGSIAVRMMNGRPVVSGRNAQRLRIVGGLLIEAGPPDVLYLNDGKGKFTPVSWTDGAFLTADGQPLKDAPRDLGLSVTMRDLTGDGLPEIYVCNDFQTPDRFWLGDGRGHFRALPDQAIRTTPHFSMAVDVADIDRDGYDDIMLSDMLSRFHRLRMTQLGSSNPPVEFVGESTDRQQARRNVLLWNRGDGTYADIANFAGVDCTDWTWAVVFLDADLDGLEDLFITNGHAYDTQDLDMSEQEPMPSDRSRASMRGGKHLKDFPPLPTPNFAFRNRGNRTFEERGAAWGFHSTNVSHGIALADLDNDGDLDIVVNCLWQPALVYRNDSNAPRVAVRLRGKAPNTVGIGARVKVLGGAVPVQTQEMICGGRYLSSDDPMRVFAAGALTNRMTIDVAWRSGRRSVVADALPNHLYEIDEAGVQPGRPAPAPPAPAPFFKDVSHLLNHTHQEAPFNDLERQPLLPKLLSRLGPGVGWYDLDGDGHDELFVGSGHGGSLAAFRSDGKGGLTRLQGGPWDFVAPEDFAGLAGWTPAPGQRALLAAVARYESADATAGSLLRFGATGSAPASGPRLPASASPGPVAVADIDGDGDLDVFVGGRVVAGRYPEAASSALYRNSGGMLELDEGNSARFMNLGLVSGAVFTDLNGDGFPELALACEWGPIRVFLNSAGQFRDSTADLGLGAYTGWWNGVSAGDLDGDGRLDLVAANWGLNSSSYAPTPERPLRIYYGDFDGNSSVDLLEAWTDWETGRLVQRRDLALLSGGLPLLRARFPTHKAFSQADAAAVLGDQFATAQQVQANALASMAFLNRGTRFEAVPLPSEAQFAPAFGVNVADFDGDGNEDVFLSQNCFAMRLEEPRLDAGRGLWLRGDGAGQFTPVRGQDSGVKIYGDQRGSAVGDFDEDGRIDLVVAQNSGVTKLYHNERARPGLRVRLAGPPGNPLGIGAVMRLVFGPKQGPSREVHGGSGYWSQDSDVQVLATPTPPAAVWVRWPGGRATTSDVPAGAKEITVDSQGKLKVLR